jgi:hypothetical protein
MARSLSAKREVRVLVSPGKTHLPGRLAGLNCSRA